jgi:precorrin-2 dehydrogenase/sirohydrochlorin ferrochelatase
MKYYPIFLRVAQRPCLVVGGGAVATQKVATLLRAEAVVTVLSPELTAALRTLAARGRIRHQARPYEAGDVRGFVLVYAATGDEAVNRQVAAEATAAGALVNIVDRPELCSFIAPAVLERGDLIIATSTSGAAPAMARRIRQDLEAIFGEEYALALQVLGRVRQRLSQSTHTAAERRRIVTALAASPLVELLRAHKPAEVDRLLASTVGEDTSLASLGLDRR